MEHQFFFDIVGKPTAICPLEFEAFGDWLTNDIGTDLTQLTLLLDVIKQLQTQKILHYQHNSVDYHLIFDKDEVELMANNDASNMTEFFDAQHDYTQNTDAQAGCGLVDLQHLLKAWLLFIR